MTTFVVGCRNHPPLLKGRPLPSMIGAGALLFCAAPAPLATLHAKHRHHREKVLGTLDRPI